MDGLIKYLVGYTDFTDVVKGGRRRDQRRVGLRKSVLIRLYRKRVQEKIDYRAYVQDVKSAFAVTELDYMRENGYHEIVHLLSLVYLIGHKPDKLFLLARKH